MGKEKRELLPRPYKGVLDRYWEWMPPEIQWLGKEKIITLYEGNTRLWRAKNLEAYLDEIYHGFKARVWLDLQGDNPTGSFKDNGMTVAVTKAAAEGKTVSICASTGNTSASAAAYSKAAGMKFFALLPEGNVAPGKLVQAFQSGAVAPQVRGNFDVALKIVKKIAEEQPIAFLNSLNPYRIEGQKTAAFSIVDKLGNAPRYHILPVGNGGNITAYWKGYKEYYVGGRASRLPHMIGYQAAGAAPIVLGKIVENPQTIASAIRIGNPARWTEAARAAEESNGIIDMASDEKLLAAYTLIHELEPISCEPSSAMSIAGLIKEIERYKSLGHGSQKFLMYIWHDCDIVCTLTGAGYKDFDTAKKVFMKDPIIIDATYDAVMDVIRSK